MAGVILPERYFCHSFGDGRDLMIAQDTVPLRYQAQYVLTDEQITALGGSALEVFRT